MESPNAQVETKARMVGQELLYHEAALCETTERSLGIGTAVSNLAFSLWLPIPSTAAHLLRVSQANVSCGAPVQPFWRLMCTCGEASVYQRCWIYHMTQHLCLASHQSGWEHSTSALIRIPGKPETQVYPPTPENFRGGKSRKTWKNESSQNCCFCQTKV